MTTFEIVGEIEKTERHGALPFFGAARALRILADEEHHLDAFWPKTIRIEDEHGAAAFVVDVQTLEGYGSTRQAGATSSAQMAIVRECDAVRDMLLSKNAAYGNSALEPVRIFSMAPPDEQLRVRIDDKLSRLKNGDITEDVILDLIGYLILLRVSRRSSANDKPND